MLAYAPKELTAPPLVRQGPAGHTPRHRAGGCNTLYDRLAAGRTAWGIPPAPARGRWKRPSAGRGGRSTRSPGPAPAGAKSLQTGGRRSSPTMTNRNRGAFWLPVADVGALVMDGRRRGGTRQGRVPSSEGPAPTNACGCNTVYDRQVGDGTAAAQRPDGQGPTALGPGPRRPCAAEQAAPHRQAGAACMVPRARGA